MVQGNEENGKDHHRIKGEVKSEAFVQITAKENLGNTIVNS